MAGDTSKKNGPPDWYAAGLAHVWLPYAQMKTAQPPLPVVRTQGSRIVLADGRELIDGIASWWTACHGYNQPHIRHAVAKQLKQMPHVMFGGLAHERRADAGAAARGAAAGRSQPRVLFGFRLGRGRGRAEDGGAILDQSRRQRADAIRRLQGRLSRRHHRRHGGERQRRRHARAVRRAAAAAPHRRSAGGRCEGGGARHVHRRARRRPSPASSSSRWCRAPAA